MGQSYSFNITAALFPLVLPPSEKPAPPDQRVLALDLPGRGLYSRLLMQLDDQNQSRRAAGMLLLATVFWGLSFPVMKALLLAQAQLLPHASSWFRTSSAVTVRFGISALILLIWTWPSLGRMTRLELWQGFGLGLCGGLGLLFQMDGLAYTSASTSAFLTQCYCLILPFVVAFRERRWPPSATLLVCLLVFIGVGVLAQVDGRAFKLGRGEWETFLGSFVFTGQILWLERPLFSRNKVSHFTLVMFVTMTLIAGPVGLVTMQGPGDWLVAFSSVQVVGLTLILVLFCTLISAVMMNQWQRYVPVTEAGLIYGAEPLFASLFALFLPALFSQWASLDYSNEKLTPHLMIGGGMISLANLLVQLRRAGAPRRETAPRPFVDR